MFFKKYKTLAMVVLVTMCFARCSSGNKEQDGIYKDYSSISKACENGVLDACLDKFAFDGKSSDMEFLEKLCKEDKSHKACELYYTSKNDKKKMCEFGNLDFCDFESDGLEIYKKIQTLAKDTKADDYYKATSYLAHFGYLMMIEMRVRTLRILSIV